MHQYSPLFCDRFWAKVEPTGFCWNWTGKTIAGYGMAWLGDEKRSTVAHRVAYQLLVGPIPAGLVLDHLCRNTRCVNPDHLDPVTQAENCRRGRAGWDQSAKTHCAQGHPYDATNTRISPRGWRCCRACARDAARRKARARK